MPNSLKRFLSTGRDAVVLAVECRDRLTAPPVRGRKDRYLKSLLLCISALVVFQTQFVCNKYTQLRLYLTANKPVCKKSFKYSEN
jgi:hypothetical protein